MARTRAKMETHFSCLVLDLTRHKAQLVNRALGDLSTQLSRTFETRALERRSEAPSSPRLLHTCPLPLGFTNSGVW